MHTCHYHFTIDRIVERLIFRPELEPRWFRRESRSTTKMFSIPSLAFFYNDLLTCFDIVKSYMKREMDCEIEAVTPGLSA